MIVRADLRFAVAEHARALRLQLVARGDDVADLEAHVVHAAGGVLLQERRDRALVAERVQQLHFRIGQFDEDDRYAVQRLRQRLRHFGAEHVTIGCGCLLQIRDSDSDVIQFSDHDCLLLATLA